jgi:hypothetical protein
MNQVPILLITLGGKERALRFDNGTLKLIAQKTQQDALTPMEGLEGYQQALYACYYGMLRDYRVQQLKPDFEMADVEEWLDAASFEDMINIIKAYNDAYTVRQDSQQQGNGDDKKK